MFKTYSMEQHLTGILIPLTTTGRKDNAFLSIETDFQVFLIRSCSTHLKKLNGSELVDSTQL